MLKRKIFQRIAGVTALAPYYYFRDITNSTAVICRLPQVDNLLVVVGDTVCDQFACRDLRSLEGNSVTRVIFCRNKFTDVP